MGLQHVLGSQLHEVWVIIRRQTLCNRLSQRRHFDPRGCRKASLLNREAVDERVEQRISVRRHHDR